MATTVVNPEPSMADLRAMLAPPAEAPKVEPEPAAQAAEQPEPAAAEPAEPKAEPVKAEDELPEGVKKRIAKEAERQAEYDRQISEARSLTKAKEAELAKLKEVAPGAEPVKQPNATDDGGPKPPQLCEAGHESETWEQFQVREAKYLREDLPAWIESRFEQKQAAKQQQAKAAERWAAAVKEHGPEFPALMESARALAPEGLQTAISGLDNWSTVAVHLAKDPAKLRELAATYNENPFKAIATLGRIEAALTANKDPKPATPLPRPITPVGGGASASTMSAQDVLEKGSFAQIKALVEKERKR